MNSSPPALAKRDQYVKRILTIRESYKSQATLVLFFHFTLQFITLIGATSLPFILNIPDIGKPIPIIISAVVAVATAISGFGKLGERARNLLEANTQIRREYYRFDLKTEAYRDLNDEEALSRFVEQIEIIRHKELQTLLSSSVYDNVQISSLKEKS